MARKKKSCPVCGQSRCVESTKCVEYREHGTINGQPTVIYTYPESK